MPIANPSNEIETADSLTVEAIEMDGQDQRGSIKFTGSFTVGGLQGAVFHSFSETPSDIDEVLRQIVVEQKKYGGEAKDLLVSISLWVPQEQKKVFLARISAIRGLIQQNDPSFSVQTFEEGDFSGDLLEAVYAPSSFTIRQV